MKILVLGGGDSPEREVSLRSAKAVADASRSAGFETLEVDPKDGLGILDNLDDTIVFPILHGKNGEDGELQAELEKRQLPYLGSGSEAMKKTFDKWATLQHLVSNGVQTAKGALVNEETYSTNPLSEQPHVLKANHGGSSIGTIIVREKNKANLDKAKKEVFSYDSQAVLEELIVGIEVTVPVLDKAALPALEVKPPEGGEFDYENKYNGQSQELCPPPSLTDEQHQNSKTIAEKVHQIMGCRHLSRVDMMMKPDGSFVVLEINPIPGLTDQSLYPKSAKVAGMDMPALVAKFAELVKRDYNL